MALLVQLWQNIFPPTAANCEVAQALEQDAIQRTLIATARTQLQSIAPPCRMMTHIKE